jgi:multicomponent K+:H+ antiporter subunit D
MMMSFIADFWSEHRPIFSILWPAFSAFILILVGHPSLDSNKHKKRLHVRRWISGSATVIGLLLAIDLVLQANTGQVTSYYLGEWAAPFGIALTLDRLSAMMVLLTYVLAVPVLLYACGGWDQKGRFFHAMFQFQLMGICGAFLTGDLFNLFVFFEVLLLASYVLLLHGQGGERFRMGLHYVVINLLASALFLIGLALIYGGVGSLNMTDVARLLLTLPEDQYALAQAGAMLLLIVFGIKAAIIPLSFWLPNTYAAASPPVMALFAIMTKVGVYSILRVNGTVFGVSPDSLPPTIANWLLPIGIVSSFAGIVGALAANNLRRLIGYMMLSSIGTIIMAIAIFTAQAWSAALFYLLHSTLIIGAFYILAEWIRSQRPQQGDRLQPDFSVYQSVLLGVITLIMMMMLAGIPPFTGFLGKVMILQSAAGMSDQWWIIGSVLIISFMALITLSRAGVQVFWSTHYPDDEQEMLMVASNKQHYVKPKYLAPAFFMLFAVLIAMMVFAAPIQQYTDRTAQQLKNWQNYMGSLAHDENHKVISVKSFDRAYLPYINSSSNKKLIDDMANEDQLLDEAAVEQIEQHVEQPTQPPQKAILPKEVTAKLEPMEPAHDKK